MLTSLPIDIFISLNIIRTLSILALILVFSSNIVTLVHDIQAVNRFMAAKVADTSSNSTMTDMLNCDYIEYVRAILYPL